MKTNRSWSCGPYHRTLLLLSVLVPVAQVEADGWTDALRENLVAYYNFEENEGDLIDQVNGFHDGAVMGASYGQEGIIGSSYFFDGDDDFIRILDHDELDFKTAFSLSVWIQKEDQVELGMLMTKSLERTAFWIEVQGGEKVRASLYEDDPPSQIQIETEDGVVPVDGTWLHVVLTAGDADRDNEFVFRIYLDATEIVSTVYNGTIGQGRFNLLIGKNLGGDINFYKGRIDEVGLWDRGLSASEVAQLYNEGAGITYCEMNCKDDDACTDDECVDGECVNTPIECDDDGDPCTIDSCDTSEGCVYVPVDCSGAGDQCNDASCDDNREVGNCDILTPVNEGGGCDDGQACTENDVCTGGSCGGSDVDCSGAGDQCNDASCDDNGEEGNCDILTPVNEGGGCDDGQACTENDVCSGGSCGGMDVDCSGAGDQCSIACCDPKGPDGNCDIFTPVQEGTCCEDGDACSENDTCSSGQCVGGPPVDCDDGHPCTDDSCDPASGCVSVANVAPCDDCDICTTEDACSDGECFGGPDLDCDDGNECTTDSCNPEIGCVHEPMGCSEGRVCNPDTGECKLPCPADFNGDGIVDAADLAVLLGSWGPCPSN